MVHYQTSWQRQSPGFETNDLGYLRRANQQSFNNWMGINWRTPTRVYRSMTGNFNAWGYWTADGLNTERAVNTNWHVNLANNMWVHAGTTQSQLHGTFCDNCARGGPAFRRSPFANYNIGRAGRRPAACRAELLGLPGSRRLWRLPLHRVLAGGHAHSRCRSSRWS